MPTAHPHGHALLWSGLSRLLGPKWAFGLHGFEVLPQPHKPLCYGPRGPWFRSLRASHCRCGGQRNAGISSSGGLVLMGVARWGGGVGWDGMG